MKMNIAILFTLVIPFTAGAQEQTEPDVLKDVFADSSTANPAGSLPDEKDFKHLNGHWMVRSVERDGAVNPAQIGQKPGDIISLEMGKERFVFG